jgi:ABC-type phosphate transport system substrate-binding protein
MRAPRSATVSIACLAMLVARVEANGDGKFKVIVNAKNPVSRVSSDLLRKAFLKKETRWRGGEALRPIDLTTKFPARGSFTHVILKKTPIQLKRYWNQQVFSGKGVPPPETDSVAEAIAYVRTTPGAVAYVPVDVDARGVKVVEVE